MYSDPAGLFFQVPLKWVQLKRETLLYDFQYLDEIYLNLLTVIQIQDGTCILSSKTGSDVGGLYNQGLQEVHHFEMKQMLGKNNVKNSLVIFSHLFPVGSFCKSGELLQNGMNSSAELRRKQPKRNLVQMSFSW